MMTNEAAYEFWMNPDNQRNDNVCLSGIWSFNDTAVLTGRCPPETYQHKEEVKLNFIEDRPMEFDAFAECAKDILFNYFQTKRYKKKEYILYHLQYLNRNEILLVIEAILSKSFKKSISRLIENILKEYETEFKEKSFDGLGSISLSG